jgi:hypothetical protein
MLTQQILLAYGGVVAADSISLFASATSTAATINFPASIIAGDLIVLLDFAADAASIPTEVVPTNFTQIGTSLALANRRQVASYKLALGTESGALTGMDGNASDQKAMYVFRLNNIATSLTVSTPNAQAAATDPTAQNVAASGGVAPLVVFGCYSCAAGAVDPRTFTVGGVGAKDGEINASTLAYLAYKIYNTSPADVSVDMADEGTNYLKSFYIEMAA